jgi:hypothetical protein
MVRIAHAERGQVTAYSDCVSVDELFSRNELDSDDRQRLGYSFSVECGGGLNFTVTGKHSPEPPGSDLKWPVLAIDQSLEFHESY